MIHWLATQRFSRSCPGDSTACLARFGRLHFLGMLQCRGTPCELSCDVCTSWVVRMKSGVKESWGGTYIFGLLCYCTPLFWADWMRSKGTCCNCRRVLLALQQPAWSRANHRDFPPAFQAAVRALLLAAAGSVRSRHQQEEKPDDGQQPLAGEQAVCCLGDLPADLLDRVVGMAAYPLAVWV